MVLLGEGGRMSWQLDGCSGHGCAILDEVKAIRGQAAKEVP